MSPAQSEIMPLVVLTGQPSSGKSSVAARLRALLEPHGPVLVIDEPSLHLERNASYAGECSGCRCVVVFVRVCGLVGD